jgi:hypothetical protein
LPRLAYAICAELMSLIEHTKPAVIDQPKAVTRNRGFQPGNKLGPGRPTGSRDKLTRSFLHSVAETFERKGQKALDRLAEDDPGAFIRVVASLMPKQLTVSSSPLDALSEEEALALAYAARKAVAAAHDS